MYANLFSPLSHNLFLPQKHTNRVTNHASILHHLTNYNAETCTRRSISACGCDTNLRSRAASTDRNGHTLSLVLSFQLCLSPKQISKMNSSSPSVLAAIYISCNIFSASSVEREERKKAWRRRGRLVVASLRELPPTSHPSALLNYPSPGLFAPQGADRSNFVSRRPQRRNYRRPGICLGPWILLTSSTTLEKADGRILVDIVVAFLVFTLLHFSLIVSLNVRHFKTRKLL